MPPPQPAYARLNKAKRFPFVQYREQQAQASRIAPISIEAIAAKAPSPLPKLGSKALALTTHLNKRPTEIGVKLIFHPYFPSKSTPRCYYKDNTGLALSARSLPIYLCHAKHLLAKLEVWATLTHALDKPWKRIFRGRTLEFDLGAIRSEMGFVHRDGIARSPFPNQRYLERAHWSPFSRIPVQLQGLERTQIIDGSVIFRGKSIRLGTLLNICTFGPAHINRVDDVIEYILRSRMAILLVNVMNGHRTNLEANRLFKGEYMQLLWHIRSTLWDSQLSRIIRWNGNTRNGKNGAVNIITNQLMPMKQIIIPSLDHALFLLERSGIGK